MEEIKIGEYVRTDNGICKVINKVDEYVRDDQLSVDYIGGMYHQVIWKKRILKHSKNIIDLIEVGDYVNGHLVVDVDNINTGAMREIYCEDNEDFGLWNEHINSVVTKEQFSSVEYRLEE